jgi:hypothetical protein
MARDRRRVYLEVDAAQPDGSFCSLCIYEGNTSIHMFLDGKDQDLRRECVAIYPGAVL